MRMMMVVLMVALLLLTEEASALLASRAARSTGYWDGPVLHAGCHSAQPAFGPASNFSAPLLLASAQRLLASVPNGKLFSVLLPNAAWPNASQTVYVIHMWGSPYEQGAAQGQLLGPTIKGFIDETWAYLEEQVEEVLKSVPSWLAKLIAEVGLDAALDATELLTRAETPSAFYEALRGMCASSGTSYQKTVRVHMLAGLTQGKCSCVGLWGSALAPGATKAMQLRALDWNMDGPFRNYAAVQVFHSPSKEAGRSFVTIGFPGFMGALSGMNDQKLAISEIGVSFPDPSFGKESRVGVPFIFMLREILQFDSTLEEATHRMKTKRRTCDLILGVGDGKSSQVRGFQYSYSVLNEISDKNFAPVNSTWHAPITDAVYWGMDWICPTFNTVLGDQIRKYHGSITPAIARQYISAVTMSGDNHLVWYDLTQGVMWAAFAAPFGTGGAKEAYWREYLEIDTNLLFAEPKPNK